MTKTTCSTKVAVVAFNPESMLLAARIARTLQIAYKASDVVLLKDYYVGPETYDDVYKWGADVIINVTLMKEGIE